MADVHYFPRYTQRENFVTNNTLLLFQRLYDYNLRKFGKFLMELDENLESLFGPLGIAYQSANKNWEQRAGWHHRPATVKNCCRNENE